MDPKRSQLHTADLLTGISGPLGLFWKSQFNPVIPDYVNTM